MSITSRINEMSSHIEQAYDELQGLGADLTNVNKNIENISMVLDDIYDSMPQVSGEGTNLTLDDTRVGKIKSTLKGNTSQSGTPTPTSPIPVNVVSGDNEINVVGKNLFDKTSNIIVDKYIGSDGTIQNEALNWYQDDYIKVSSSTTYYMSANSNTTIRAALYDENKNFISRIYSTGNLQVDTTATTKYVRLSGYNNLNNNIMLELSNAPTTYEPYQGNTYNIDLPVENLFDTSLLPITKNGVTISKDDEGNVVLNGTPTITSGYIGFDFTLSSTYLKAGTYTSSIKNKIGGIGITINQTTPGGILNLTMSDTVNSKTGTLTADLINGTIGVNVRYDVGTLTNFILNPQLEIGSKAHKYTPYGTTPIELCKIGNYQDYFYKDNGKWYLHKEIGEVVLNGSEEWYKSTSYPGNYYCQSAIPYAIAFNVNCFSNLTNIFWDSLTQLSNGDNGIMLEGGGTNKTIDFKISSISTLADFKTFLGNNNLLLYYILATPTNTKITYEPLLEQLEAYYYAKSRATQTNISQVNNDLPFIISASALKEWQESTSLNSTLSMVNPLSLGNTLNTQENDIQPIEVDNIEPLEEEENEES